MNQLFHLVSARLSQLSFHENQLKSNPSLELFLSQIEKVCKSSLD